MSFNLNVACKKICTIIVSGENVILKCTQWTVVERKQKTHWQRKVIRINEVYVKGKLLYGLSWKVMGSACLVNLNTAERVENIKIKKNICQKILFLPFQMNTESLVRGEFDITSRD